MELAHKRAANLEEAARATALAIMLGTAPEDVPSCPPDFLDAVLRGTATS